MPWLARTLTAAAPEPLHRGDLARVLWLVVLIVAVYGQVAGHPFIEWDDPEYVSRHPRVLQGLNTENFLAAWGLIHSANWHPLTWLSHMLDVSLWGTWAGGHHLTSVFWHAAATALLYLFLASTTGCRGRSLFAAALFAVHPLHVESVAWVAERKDVLAAFFWFSTLLLYARYAAAPSFPRYLATLGAFALGLAAKPMLVSLPLILLLMDAWPLQRIPHPAWASGNRSALWMLLREKLPFFFLAALSCAMTLIAQQTAIVPVADMPLAERLGQAVLATATYVWQTFWPLELSFFYPPTPLAPLPLFAAILTLLALAGWALITLRHSPIVAVGLLWFALALLPVIGLVKVGLQAHADRYTYLPHAGLFIALLWGLHLPQAPRLLTGATVGITALLGVGAWHQVQLWQSGDSLFGAALRHRADNYVALVQWGETRFRAGDLDQAATLAQRALQASPQASTQMHGYQLLGHVAMARGDFHQAIEHYTRALAALPDVAMLHYNRGTARMSGGDDRGAGLDFERAIQLNPRYSAAHTNLGVVRQRLGDAAGAISAYRQALAAEPANLEARANLARRLAATGDLQGAHQELQELLRRRPDHPAGRNLYRQLTAPSP